MQPDLTKVSKTIESQQDPESLSKSTQHGIPNISNDQSIDSFDESFSGAFQSQGNSPKSGNASNLTKQTETHESSINQINYRVLDISDIIPSSHSESSRQNTVQKPFNVTDLPNEILIHSLSHLDPENIVSVSLVCKSFYHLVTAPDAWRTAFARFFPGQSSIKEYVRKELVKKEKLTTARRLFARLTQEGQWRDEYVKRAILLRCLEKQRPASLTSPSSSPTQSQPPVAITFSDTSLKAGIRNIDVNFNLASGQSTVIGLCHAAPQFRLCNFSAESEVFLDDHKTDRMGMAQIQYQHDIKFGLGPGDIICCENPMDVSRTFGMVCGGGYPGGLIWMRNMRSFREFIDPGYQVPNTHCKQGVPLRKHLRPAITAVWIAKTESIPSLSEGTIGVLTGDSSGVVSAYSLGVQGMRDRYIGTGKPTAKWVLSPGVPIIAFAVDDDYSLKRKAQNRIWGVALNALGEVFYLTKIPKFTRPTNIDEQVNAWIDGRSVYWNLAEPTRRTVNPEAPETHHIDGSYSPRSSWNGMCLSEDQIVAEMHEIERYFEYRPSYFRKICNGWDMQRKLQVDFAGDDGNLAGEIVIVTTSGYNPETLPRVTRYVRCRLGNGAQPKGNSLPESGKSTPRASEKSQSEFSSIFGSPTARTSDAIPTEIDEIPLSADNLRVPLQHQLPIEEWRTSEFTSNAFLVNCFTCTAIDKSFFATKTLSEDFLVSSQTAHDDSSDTSSTCSVPLAGPIDASLIPGQRARFFAVATDTGAILVWDMRRSIPRSQFHAADVQPVRVIQTDAGKCITALALNSLYLVHGDTDGIVQAWDVLASRIEPIATISGRPSKKLVRQARPMATALRQVGRDVFQVGCIVLDTDATVLRGVVTVGSIVRAWHYQIIDGNWRSMSRNTKRKQQRRKRGERGSNGAGSGSGSYLGLSKRGGSHYLAAQVAELKSQLISEKKNKKRMQERFAMGVFDGEQDVELAMALSQETFERENASRQQSFSSDVNSSYYEGIQRIEDVDVDSELAEALKRSLNESQNDTDSKSQELAEALERSLLDPYVEEKDERAEQAEQAEQTEQRDLEMALRLSLLESETVTSWDGTGKGKGRA